MESSVKATRIRIGTAICLTAVMMVTGCVKNGGEDEVEAGFTEAIPNDDILEVALDADGEGQGLTIEQGLEGQPSRIADHASRTAQRIETARKVTHQIVDTVLSNSTPSEETLGGLECRVFTHDDGDNFWRLQSCVKNKNKRRFAFLLQGRAADDDEASFLNVMAGEGAVLARFNGKRRGAGLIGYELDNLNTLRGEGPTGKVAIGFRAAGRFRQVTAAMKNFQPVGADDDFSAVYRYNHVVGKGGVLKFAFKADVVSLDGDDLSEDKDGEDESGRVSLAYARTGKARVAGILCGGSLGEGECVRLRECFESDSNVTFGALFLNPDERPDFDATACPGEADLPIVADEAPSEGELEASDADNGDIPGPAVEEPAEEAALEG